MADSKVYNIDDATIKKLGLQKTEAPEHSNIDPATRLFTFPNVENAYIMENDLYGNPMPAGSCFLAFQGKHGFVGQHLSIETLKNASAKDIKALIDANIGG